MATKIPEIKTPLADELRQKFIEFYLARGHAEIPNVSLVPNVDSTLLFTNSGMFPLVNYFTGAKHPLGNRLVNFQRCIRTGEKDLAEIGDWKHSTMFEMMGNWSLGDYFKSEQIAWVLELYLKVFGLDVDRIYVSVFAGDADAPEDTEAIEIWQREFAKYGITAEVADVYFETAESGKEVAYRFSDAAQTKKEYLTDWDMFEQPNVKIFRYSKKENWWQRGEAVGELGGPDSEIFYNTGASHDYQKWGVPHPNSDSPTFLEIGNSVFMQYQLSEQLKWEPLAQKNIDFGGGFTRVLLAKQKLTDLFETEVFQPIISFLEELTGLKYKENGQETENTKYFRIIADHTFGATFIIFDGVRPGNKEQGYILRRFIRRAVRMGKQLGIEQSFLAQVAEVVVAIYAKHYPGLAELLEEIQSVLTGEEAQFRKTLQSGLKELHSASSERGIYLEGKVPEKKITGELLFDIYQTYGFPLEMALEELHISGTRASDLIADFKTAEQKHKDLSKQGAEKKFTGGLADSSVETTRLHTLHHITLRALQLVLGADVHQRGSNITSERLRMDFSYPEKMSAEQIAEVEKIVNTVISKNLTVQRLELPLEVAESLGAEQEFGQKYGQIVSVYLVGDLSPETTAEIQSYYQDSKNSKELLGESYLDFALQKIQGSEIFSKEFCGGPHIRNMKEISELGKQFKIFKEESSGRGIRRIKAGLI